jgi:hypothetical protein
VTNVEPFHAAGPVRRHFFHRGDVVRVIYGPLADDTGVIEGIIRDKRCAVSLAGTSQGVLIVVEAVWLEPADTLSYGGTIDWPKSPPGT